MNSTERLSEAHRLRSVGNYVAAEGMYRDLLRSRPHDARALHGLGLAVWHQGRCDEALEAMRAAKLTLPDASDILMDLGTMLGAAHRFDEAVEMFENASRHQQGAIPLISLGNVF